MEIREIVRLKQGVGGLGPPNNIAILLDREKINKEPMAHLFTPKGHLTVRWTNLKEGTGTFYEGDKNDHKAMTDLLRNMAAKEKGLQMLQMEPQQILESKGRRDLWATLWAHIDEKTIHMGGLPVQVSLSHHNTAFTAEEIASIHFHPKVLGPRHLQAVSRLLASTEGPHSPFFSRTGKDGAVYYVPFTREAMEDVERDIAKLRALRGKLVHEEEGEPARDPRERRFKLRKRAHDDLAHLPLDPITASLLKRVCSWGAYYLEHATWPTSATGLRRTGLGSSSPFSLGGTTIRSLDGFDLEKFISDLFLDLSQDRRRDLPSNILRVLLEMGLITWREASESAVDFKLASGAQRFHREFPEHVMAASTRLPEGLLPQDREGRMDLTALETYTIDPVDAKDFDDAVSLQFLPNGGVAVWVHIADVSHYVRPGNLMDGEARFRSTSVYLPTGVLPMLPPRLSEDLCSLKAGSERLALSTRIELGKDMEPEHFSHHSSVIKVSANLDYDTVDRWIDEGKEPFATLYRIALYLSEKGSRLSLETPERRIRFDTPNSVQIAIKRPTKATKMIEEMMVQCNEFAAMTIQKSGRPTAFRVHPLPDRRSMEGFNGACRALDLPIRIPTDWIRTKNDGSETTEGSSGEDLLLKALLRGGKVSLNAPLGSESSGILEIGHTASPPLQTPPDGSVMNEAVDAFNKALSGLREMTDQETADILNLRLLRVLPRALYSDVNIGHFGLRSLCYCHFTSPIRRYADILAHRTIKALLASEGRGPPVPWDPPSAPEVSSMIENMNEMSGSAEDWEREMVNVALSTKVVMDPSFLKGIHGSRVMALTPSAAFFLLDDNVTEGRIATALLSPYKLTLDESESMLMLDTGNGPDARVQSDLILRAAETGDGAVCLMKLGDRRRCAIHSVSVVEGRVDLSLSG